MDNNYFIDSIDQINKISRTTADPQAWAKEVASIIAGAFSEIGLKTETLTNNSSPVAVTAIDKGNASGLSIGFVNSIYQSNRCSIQANSFSEPEEHSEDLKIVSSLNFLAAQLNVAKELSAINHPSEVQFHIGLRHIDCLPGTPTSAIIGSGKRVDAVVAKAAQIGDVVKSSAVATGVLIGTIKVEGVTTHCGNRASSIRAGGLGDAVGVNALEKGMLVISSIRQLDELWIRTKSHPRLPLASCTIGISSFRADSGQLVPFSFPNSAQIDIRVDYGPHESEFKIREEIEKHVITVGNQDPWLKDHPPSFTWLNLYPAFDLDPGHKLVKSVRAAIAKFSIVSNKPEVETSFVEESNGAFYSAAGIPTTLLGCGAKNLNESCQTNLDLDKIEELKNLMLETVESWNE
jgi:acetylornithine deacetylase